MDSTKRGRMTADQGFWAWWALLAPYIFPVVWRLAILATITKVWWPR